MNNQYDENNHIQGQDGTGEEANTSEQINDSTYGQPLYTGGDATGQDAPAQDAPADEDPPSGEGFESSSPQYGAPGGNYGYTQHAQTEYHWTDQTKKKKEHKKSGFGGFVRVVCIVLVCVLLSGAAAYGVVEYRIRSGDLNVTNQVVLGSETTPAEENGGASNTSLSGDAMTAADLYDMARQQVVGVNTDVTTNVFGQTSSTAVSGSGFIISTDGYIMTNYHVVEYAVLYGYDLTAMLYDGTSYDATIIGYEEENDVAIIKINATGLTPVTFGDSGTMSVGDTIYAVGNPLGELTYTMTSGIVSALDRRIDTSESDSINMFQIDAAVNSGNSGGPVYNAAGKVIGIVTAKYASTGVEGLGFAIPIDDVLDIASQLIENGYVTGKPHMGVVVVDVTGVAASYYNLAEGAYVTLVESGSCAETAGIRVGDIITAMGETAVASSRDLKAVKKEYSAGDTTTVTVYRSGESQTLTILFDEESNTSNAGVDRTLPSVTG